MAKKPENDVNTVISLPQTQAERNKMRNRAEFGDKIRAYRKACALSQPQLAEILGVTKNSITNWETGISRPELQMIPKLCQALSISADLFFGMPASKTALDKSELTHMNLYRSLDHYKQRTVDALMESMIENDLLAFREDCVKTFSHIERDELPASAGTGMPLTDSYEHEYVFLRNSRSVCRADTIITVYWRQYAAHIPGWRRSSGRVYAGDQSRRDRHFYRSRRGFRQGVSAGWSALSQCQI